MYRFDACCVHAGAHPSLRECVCLHAFGCGMAWPSLERMENARVVGTHGGGPRSWDGMIQSEVFNNLVFALLFKFLIQSEKLPSS